MTATTPATPMSDSPGSTETTGGTPGDTGRNGRTGRTQAPRRAVGGWPVARLIAIGIGVMSVFSLVAIVVGAFALTDLSSARSRVDTLDPAVYQAYQLYAALLNQET